MLPDHFRLAVLGVLFLLAACVTICIGCSPACNIDAAVVEARARINEPAAPAEPLELVEAPRPEPVDPFDPFEPLALEQFERLQPACGNPLCCCDPCEHPGCRCSANDGGAPSPEPTEAVATSEGVKTEGAPPGNGLIVIGATWCVPCHPVKAAAEGVEGVRILDADRDADKVSALWQGADPSVTRIIDGRYHVHPATLPAFVQTRDGKPTRWFVTAPDDPHPWTAKRIEYLRDADRPAPVQSAPEPARVHPQPIRFFQPFVRPFFQSCAPGGCR